MNFCFLSQDFFPLSSMQKAFTTTACLPLFKFLQVTGLLPMYVNIQYYVASYLITL